MVRANPRPIRAGLKYSDWNPTQMTQTPNWAMPIWPEIILGQIWVLPYFGSNMTLPIQPKTQFYLGQNLFLLFLSLIFLKSDLILCPSWCQLWRRSSLWRRRMTPMNIKRSIEAYSKVKVLVFQFKFNFYNFATSLPLLSLLLTLLSFSKLWIAC